MRVLHFAGPSGFGKTRVIEALLNRVPAQAVIKFSHHPLSPEEPGRDTARFGSHGVPTWLVTPTGLIERRPIGPADRRTLYRRMAREYDEESLVIIEGDKEAPFPKIWLGDEPPSTVALSLVVGPESPSEGIAWISLPLPIDDANLQRLVATLSAAWQKYCYSIPREDRR